MKYRYKNIVKAIDLRYSHNQKMQRKLRRMHASIKLYEHLIKVKGKKFVADLIRRNRS